ncbi:MAG: NUDIX hydrolase [Methanobacteriota archaeon]|nr:MAG: NUDIX hydrolase [Euryarchaeota archaeon]
MNTFSDASAREYPKHPRVGVGVVAIKDNKILLVKRAFEPGANKWSIPGGMVEVGERLSDAGVRETEEETGIRVQMLELISAFDMIDFDDEGKVKYHYVLVDFLARPTGGDEKPSEEITDLKWVSYETAKDMDLTETARRALSELFGLDFT